MWGHRINGTNRDFAGTLGPLRAWPPTGGWRDGWRVPGHRPGAGPDGGGQGARPTLRPGPRLRGPVPSRGSDGGRAGPSQRGGHLRQRIRGRPPLHRDGVRPGPDPGRAAPPPWQAPTRAGRRGRPPGLPGAGGRARAGAGAPRHQARQRDGRPGGPGQGDGLRDRQSRRHHHHNAEQRGAAGGHGAVLVARAGPRPTGGWALGPVCTGLCAVRAAHRHAAVSWPQPAGGGRTAGQRAGWNRWALPAGALLVVVVAVAVAVWSLRSGGGTVQPQAGPPSTALSAATTTTAPAQPTTMVTTQAQSSVSVAMANLTEVITTGQRQGTIDQGGEDLLHQAEDVVRAVQEGHADDARKKFEELEHKADALIGEGKISPQAVGAVRQALAQFDSATQRSG